MAGTARTIVYLESKFQTGDIPTQQDFYDLFVSYVHWEQVLQATGSSTTSVMSQKAVSDAITAAINTALSQKWKSPEAKVRTTAALAANTQIGLTLVASANGAFPAQDTIAIGINDTVLVADEPIQSKNGIYTLTTVGSGAAPWVLTRRADSDTGTELESATIPVSQGALYQDTTWRQTTDSVVLGSSSIVWAPIQGAALPDWSDTQKGKLEKAIQAEAETVIDATESNRDNLTGFHARAWRWAWDKMYATSTIIVTILSNLGIFDARTTVTIATGTLTLDMLSKRFGRFVMNTASSSDFVIAFSNVTNMIDLEVLLILTGTRAVTLPTGTRMQLSEKDAGRWNDSTRVLTLSAATASYYKLVFSKDGSVYICDSTNRYL